MGGWCGGGGQHRPAFSRSTATPATCDSARRQHSCCAGSLPPVRRTGLDSMSATHLQVQHALPALAQLPHQRNLLEAAGGWVGSGGGVSWAPRLLSFSNPSALSVQPMLLPHAVKAQVSAWQTSCILLGPLLLALSGQGGGILAAAAVAAAGSRQQFSAIGQSMHIRLVSPHEKTDASPCQPRGSGRCCPPPSQGPETGGGAAACAERPTCRRRSQLSGRAQGVPARNEGLQLVAPKPLQAAEMRD